MKFSMAALVFTALLLTACSDDPVTPPGSDKFVITTTGTYYVSNVDSVHNNPADTANPSRVPAGRDSTYIVSTTTVAGRTAVFLQSTHTFNSVSKTDTTYLAQEGNAIFSYYTLGITDIPNVAPIIVAKAWVRIGDNGASSWKALDTTLPNVSFNYNGTPISATVKVVLDGSKVGTETITMNGTSHTATHYRVIGAVTMGTIVGDIFVYSNEDYWFVKNVGMVKYERGVTTVKGAILPTAIKVSGKSKTTTTYKVF